MGKLYPVPAEVAGWSWGAFFLNWIWAIGNRTWVGLFAVVPYVGFIVAIILGVKGREWAWQNKRWESIEHFNRVQRRWSIWASCLLVIPVIGIFAAVAIPAYSDYTTKSKNFSAYMHAKRAASHVGAYIINHRSLPATLADAGATEPAPAGVLSITLNQKTAQIEVTMIARSRSGPTFSLVPSTDNEGYVTWSCEPGNINPSLLPKDCR